MWKKVRSAIMFGIACITSPCCTPLIVPLILALFAGTPVAVWMGQNVGWVYAGLTLVSVVSLVLGLRWMNSRSSLSRISPKPIPTIELNRPNESNG